ncbi:hypothetical protein [Paraburkholderia haematera]|uniref:hypothetical protein n=1 Tax=Paraburkholderia haematera TaxID=2793077 RepID=UPI001F377FC1|nr:hypothetical protein [Paraburkholderia haematera]
MSQLGNFSFLAEHSPLLAQLGAAAERAFAADPNTTLIKLRQLGEAMAQDLASRFGVAFDQTTKQSDLLFQLDSEAGLDKTIRGLFHTLRVEGEPCSPDSTLRSLRISDDDQGACTPPRGCPRSPRDRIGISSESPGPS